MLLVINQFDGAAASGITAGSSRIMLPYSSIKVFCLSNIIGTIIAKQNINVEIKGIIHSSEILDFGYIEEVLISYHVNHEQGGGKYAPRQARDTILRRRVEWWRRGELNPIRGKTKFCRIKDKSCQLMDKTCHNLLLMKKIPAV
ncbi:MAG: hypothetical protein A2X48_15160 [Lentisphaerae bacterium GWF2_49_21]|nr:MAG: hypothetical protein A2X48_15160 [Lentisphaerae bacterium GWF2_49_21]